MTLITKVITGAPVVSQPGVFTVYGFEIKNSKNVVSIVGIQDILASDYTWSYIRSEGFSLQVRVMERKQADGSVVHQLGLVTANLHGVTEVRIPDNVLNPQIRDQYIKAQGFFTPEAAYDMLTIVLVQMVTIDKKYKEGTLVVKASMTDYVPANNWLVDYINTKFPRSRSSLVMNKPTDELYISIPDYATLTNIYRHDSNTWDDSDDSEDSEDEEYYVSPAETTSAFSIKSVFDASAGKNSSSVQYFEQLNTPINAKNFKVDMGFPYYDSINYHECSRMSDNPYVPEYIIGSEDNNELEVAQPNEAMYYRDLQLLIRHGLQAENEYMSQAEVDKAIELGQHSRIVDAYLKDMTRLAFALTRRHTGHCGYSSVTAENEQTDSGGIEYIFSGLYSIERAGDTYRKVPFSVDRVQMLQSEYRLFNGFDPLCSYIENYTWGAFVWAKALIILLRFGEKKPRLLYIAGRDTSSKKYFDLEQCSITEFSGNKETWTPIPLPDGAEYEFLGVVMQSGYPADPQEFSKYYQLNSTLNNLQLPIGVVLSKRYQGIPDRELTFVDMPNFMQLLIKQQPKILNVFFDKQLKKVVLNGDLSTKGFQRIPLADTVSALELNNNLRICYYNIVLAREYSDLTHNNPAYSNNPIKIDSNINNVFSLVSRVFQTNPLSKMEMIASIATEQDVNIVAQVVGAYGIGADTEQLPFIYHCALNYTGIFIRLYRALLGKNDQPAGWTLDQVLNTSYEVFCMKADNVSRKASFSASLQAIFNSTMKGLDSYYSIVDGSGRIVAHFAQRKKQFPDGKVQKLLIVWKCGDYDVSKLEKLSSYSIKWFMDAVHPKYKQAKEAGTLSALLGKTVIVPNENTLEDIAKFS